jgi:hypothetical protein
MLDRIKTDWYRVIFDLVREILPKMQQISHGKHWCGAPVLKSSFKTILQEQTDPPATISLMPLIVACITITTKPSDDKTTLSRPSVN